MHKPRAMRTSAMRWTRGAANERWAATPSNPAVGSEVGTVWIHLTAGSETQISERKLRSNFLEGPTGQQSGSETRPLSLSAPRPAVSLLIS